MTKTIHAIYEHGVLRPLEPIEGITENSEVEITLLIEKVVSHPLLRFAGILSEEEAKGMIKVVEEEFERPCSSRTSIYSKKLIQVKRKSDSL